MKSRIDLPIVLLILIVLCKICMYGNDSVRKNSYKCFEEIRLEWDSVSRHSDARAYTEKVFEASKHVSFAGGYEKGDTSYMMHSYRTLLPFCSIELPKYCTESKRKYLLDDGGVISIQFINNFDISLNDTTVYTPIAKSCARHELEIILEMIQTEVEIAKEDNTKGNWLAMDGAKYDSQWLYEGLGTNGDTILYIDGHLADFYESVGGADFDFIEKTYEEALKYMLKKAEWMLSQENEPWAGNNLRVKKGLYVIDFLFIKEEPFDLVHKVVSSFELLPMPDLDPQKENARLLESGSLNIINKFF